MTTAKDGRRTISNIFSGDWYKRTLVQEQKRLGDPFVRLLAVELFIDATNLDKLSRNTATPIIVTLLNFTLDVLHSDASKKLIGFFPDVPVTKEQWDNDEVSS